MEWDDFISDLQAHGFEQWEAVRDIVQALQGLGVRLPSAMPGEDGCISLSWNSKRFSFQLEVMRSGLVEWFFMDHETQRHDGIGEPIPFDRSAPYVRRLLMTSVCRWSEDDPDPWMDEPLTPEERALPAGPPVPWTL
jgi:hypothetical protein